VNLYQAPRHHNPENSTLHGHCHENFKPNKEKRYLPDLLARLLEKPNLLAEIITGNRADLPV
jgi:hypothetical protein